MTDNKQYPELPVIEHWLNNTYTASQMRQYVDEDRAMRANTPKEANESVQPERVPLTRDDIIKIAREADIIDFRDDDSDPHVKQMIDFFEVVIDRAVAAVRAMRAAPQGELTEREAFEAHFSEPPFEWEILRCDERSVWTGNYQLYEHQCAWEAWQARAALPQPQEAALTQAKKGST